MSIDIKKSHKGKFTEWCLEHGFKGVNCSCIKKALAVGDTLLKKQANFAKNLALKGKCND